MNHTARRINKLAKLLRAQRYLEIGVCEGTTFQDVAIHERVAVDPAFRFDPNELANTHTRFCPIVSDEFFAGEPVDPAFDIVFLDGLHTFEQVMRDFSNAILRTGGCSAILIDDTLPSDIYSAIPDQRAVRQLRRAAGIVDKSWHGDVFKLVFYIHDFWPSLNYRTIAGSGNAQTLVWRSNSEKRVPRFNNLERISRLSYLDMQENIDILKKESEDFTVDLCAKELN